VWYWVRGRALAKTIREAWFSYDAARYLELPFDFLSSPNLERLRKEQSDITLRRKPIAAVVAAHRT